MNDEEIRSQLNTFGYHYDEDLTAAENVIQFMNTSNGVTVTPKALATVTKVSFMELDLASLIVNKHRQVDEMEVPEGGIAGVVSGGRLYDGYHRLQWLRNRGFTKGLYIVLE